MARDIFLSTNSLLCFLVNYTYGDFIMVSAFFSYFSLFPFVHCLLSPSLPPFLSLPFSHPPALPVLELEIVFCAVWVFNNVY